jgi:DNA-binding beta-propeller fold protein YncE
MGNDMSNSLRKLQSAAWVLAVLTLGLTAWHPAFAGQKKKTAAAPDPASKRIVFDVSKLMWPNPPSITRVKWLTQFTGEKIDFDAYDKTKKKKVKQSWMDRLAGAQTAATSDVKLPFQLIRPYGVASDSKGNIYAADQGVGGIFIFNPETNEVQVIGNDHEAHFGMINGLAMDDNDRLFVTDVKLRQVIVINPQHKEETSFGADVLMSPAGIAVDTENRFLYVVDTQNDDVVVFDADSLKLLRKIGTPGKKHKLTDPGTFALPTGVAVDADGNVYVTDTLNNRVEIFDAEGNFISTFGKNGDGPGFLARPKGIAIDRDGHLWVVDAVQSRIQVFDREGRLLIYFGAPGAYPGQFGDPYGITIDKFNRVIVSEQFPGRLQAFRYVTDAEAETEKKARAAAEGENKPSTSAVPVQAKVSADK